MNNSAQIAFNDITEYINNQNQQVIDEHNDVWIVTPTRMYNKETRKLNTKLGIHKINKRGKCMIRYKKK